MNAGSRRASQGEVRPSSPNADLKHNADPKSGRSLVGTPTANKLLAQIVQEEQRLAVLDRQRNEIRDRLDVLRTQLDETRTAPLRNASLSLPLSSGAPATAAEKVRLFRSLFRGREEVFPTRFVSKKTGKPGYAPACGNKFVRGVCGLPAVKCGDCPNQAFLPVNDQAILDHLRGRHVMGVYPLLQDETCWFLAVDFDKAEWKEDVTSFGATCQAIGVPVAVERSRSGNGAHAWFFFTSPVAAAIARKMGCYLITETMSRRHQLGMASYDRLFPSQDTMPRKGFGNLIALPLQHDARKHGHTAFLDSNLEPYPDQWAFLVSVPRIEPATAEAIAQEAVRRGQVIGVRLADMTDDDQAAPWAQPPSRKLRRTHVAGPLPNEVRAVLAQRLFIEKSGLPSPLLNQIKRHRLHPRKKEVRIFDYVDAAVPALRRMFEKRLRTYRAVGYARGEAPLGYSEPVDEPIVEYDDEALRHFDEAD